MSRRVRFGDNIKILRSRNKMTQQEEIDLEKELEKRFDELFGITEED